MPRMESLKPQKTTGLCLVMSKWAMDDHFALLNDEQRVATRWGLSTNQTNMTMDNFINFHFYIIEIYLQMIQMVVFPIFMFSFRGCRILWKEIWGFPDMIPPLALRKPIENMFGCEGISFPPSRVLQFPFHPWDWYLNLPPPKSNELIPRMMVF